MHLIMTTEFQPLSLSAGIHSLLRRGPVLLESAQLYDDRFIRGTTVVA